MEGLEPRLEEQVEQSPSVEQLLELFRSGEMLERRSNFVALLSRRGIAQTEYREAAAVYAEGVRDITDQEQDHDKHVRLHLTAAIAMALNWRDAGDLDGCLEEFIGSEADKGDYGVRNHANAEGADDIVNFIDAAVAEIRQQIAEQRSKI